MTPRPQRSTLFPYTTLFRSRAARCTGRCAPSCRSRSGARQLGAQDRKSTRLNSSHVAISYAVFCLEKKRERGRKDDRVDRLPDRLGTWQACKMSEHVEQTGG